MATENAAIRPPLRAGTRDIPGVQDLLVERSEITDPERMMQACENVLLPITSGIEAIGALMAAAADPEVECEVRTYRDAGFLLELLADIQGWLHMRAGDAACTAYRTDK